MPSGKLLRSDQSETASAVRRALGASGDEPVNVFVPDTRRRPEWPTVKPPPATRDGWEALRLLTEDEMRQLGMPGSDENLRLFPVEWYESIPDGLVVVTISDEVVPFSRRRFNKKGVRYGALPFGFRPHRGRIVEEGRGKKG